MKTGEHKRGFSEFRKKVAGKDKFLASCQSCMSMEDSCTNPNVTSFDMVETETNKYCSFWKGYAKKGRKYDDE